jgi:hypothetical protein
MLLIAYSSYVVFIKISMVYSLPPAYTAVAGIPLQVHGKLIEHELQGVWGHEPHGIQT